jgi:hypothetical protein
MIFAVGVQRTPDAIGRRQIRPRIAPELQRQMLLSGAIPVRL